MFMLPHTTEHPGHTVSPFFDFFVSFNTMGTAGLGVAIGGPMGLSDKLRTVPT